jgi:hypothetical protein
MKYLVVTAMILMVGCEPNQIPKEIQKTEVKPKAEAAKTETPPTEKPEIDPRRLETLEQKVNYIMDIIVKDVDCSKKRKAADEVLNTCMHKCDADFPQPENEDDPPPALVNGVCVQVKLAHTPENPKNKECNDGCWEELRSSTKCSP